MKFLICKVQSFMISTASICLLIFFLFYNCNDRVVKLKVQGASYCASARFQKPYKYPSEDKITEIFKNELLKKYSEKSIDISVAYGFSDLLLEFETEKKRGVNSQNLINLEKKVFQNVYFALSDVEASESELKCYDDRFSEIIYNLKESEDDIVQSNSFKAILVGGLGTFLDGATSSNPSINQIVVLTSGMLITYFSYLAYDPIVVVDFAPKSTMLKDIWNGPKESLSYSYPIWFLLSKEYESHTNKITPRKLLIKRWEENNFFGKDPKERERLLDLYFGKGGVSTIKELSNRKEMVLEVMVILGLYKQNVRNFEAELLYSEE